MNKTDTKIKIALIGETGCGKSTFINALIGEIVLPESPMTSTPVLTYLEYSERGNDYAEIVDIHQQITEVLEIETFIKKYCFNVEEQREVDRRRFRNISHAVLHISAEFLKNGVQLIDTLGFSASSHDTETTEGILSDDIDLIFYVVSKNMLADVEIERIQNLLGYRTVKQLENGCGIISGKISLSKLYFICNEKEGMIAEGLRNSISRIFHSEDCDQSAAQVESFAKEHILKCNFLAGRTLNCGIYPYRKYLSPSPTEEESEFAADMERRQKRYLKLGYQDEESIMWEKAIRMVDHMIKERISAKFRKLLDEADRGLIDSQVFVGFVYETGRYVQQDYVRAFHWYEKAARQGNLIAQTRLALLYEKGKGVERSYFDAYNWYKTAAEQNQGDTYSDRFGMYCLGLMYENGDSVARNYTESFRWYKKSALAGCGEVYRKMENQEQPTESENILEFGFSGW